MSPKLTHHSPMWWRHFGEVSTSDRFIEAWWQHFRPFRAAFPEAVIGVLCSPLTIFHPARWLHDRWANLGDSHHRWAAVAELYAVITFVGITGITSISLLGRPERDLAT